MMRTIDIVPKDTVVVSLFPWYVLLPGNRRAVTGLRLLKEMLYNVD